jgi:hypothetical protein
MRRHYRDGVNVMPLEQLPVVDDQIESLRGRERRDRVVIDVAACHHLEARAVGQARDDLLAPPAKPDNTDPDHSALFPCFVGPDNAGRAANAQWFAKAPCRTSGSYRPESLTMVKVNSVERDYSD